MGGDALAQEGGEIKKKFTPEPDFTYLSGKEISNFGQNVSFIS